MNAPKSPLPRPTALSQPFWDACREGRLMVQRCRDCGHHEFIPQPCCGACLSGTLDWVESSGRGVVYSHTTVYRPQQPSFRVPYTIVVVELEEGWHMVSNLLGVAPADIRVGLPVEVFFEKRSQEITLPFFRRRERADQ